ncbi:LTA synthase family protein [Maribacter sp. X9]|uniref:LTA synthase family protein n=1 Tax=Maribacter sp. X9 TaxID=3402159 RepID=UPI003AF37D15
MNQKKAAYTLIRALQWYSGYAVFSLLMLLLFSVTELLFYTFNHPFPFGFGELLTLSLIRDFILWSTWVFIPAIFFVPIHLINPRIAKFLIALLTLVFFTIHFILIAYFNNSLVLLGSDFFGYSLEDIKQTVGASGDLSLSVVLLLIFIGLVGLGLYTVPEKIKAPKWAALALPLFSVLFFSVGSTDNLTKPALGTDYANNLVIHKSEHFYKAANSYFFRTDDGVDIYAESYLGKRDKERLSRLKTIKYTNESFPFLHPRSQEDVLSPFFKPKEKMPNLVFIVVEGLGRAYTNEGAYLGNFTPFLDSLSRKSLYWKNFLSNGGRTFAVLPSLLGSLPFAKNGFLELRNKEPKQLSLLNILESKGYETTFYYGGDTRFDGMKDYLEKNNIGRIYDEYTFPSSYKKLPSRNDFSWGYGDQELYKLYLEQQKPDSLDAPRLNVFLTVATHSPFVVNNSRKYEEIFEKRIETMNLTEAQKKEHGSYKKQYVTVLYADDALKGFFKAYKKREDYENTIFFITGDHRIPEIPMGTKIDRYHVPLIVYSPLLKRTATIASISSHFDLAPSLLNYFATNHQLKLPEQVSFMGTGLDTVADFRNIHQIPIMQTKTDMVDFVSGNFHLNGDDVFELDANMGETLIDNTEIKEELVNAFQAFKHRNTALTEGAPLIPDSIYKKYGTKN